ncbi:methyltransferase domain-containing protein [Spirulina subsalsa FACHB-351]|uniref:Methyltransferase domain-containing protein n=1 Tax=Spirulina subsalsa FACHB-351 TaxID=234711 RepID=A0ABT3L9X3_9CYAN|nr:class I SAM-dependent methyltransferase [Spirulina subsalsa]MCW6038302.1 methyltransferase domain-containing protein [Spirulina subsalsa FACHB-351]
MSLKVKISSKEQRTVEQITEHYLIEKQLAQKLLNSTVEQRQKEHLYTKLYDELYQKVPHHSQLTRQVTDESKSIWKKHLKVITEFLTPQTVFLEVGPGRCDFSREVSRYVQKVYAVDVSPELTQDLQLPGNVEVIISDGCTIPVPEESIDLIYSHQLMEHLHPDDAIAQLENIYKALKSGGLYVCITPHALSGPHDISKYFDEVATGFHLKEYRISELTKLFHAAGFSQVFLRKISSKFTLQIPLILPVRLLIEALEKLLGYLPYSQRRWIAEKSLIFRTITLVGVR